MRIPTLLSKRTKLFKKRPKSSDLVSWHHHPFAVPIFTLVGLFFVASAGFFIFGGQTIGADDSKVVQLYVDGQARTVPTRAQTVGELLKKTGVELHEGDVTEPSQDSALLPDFNVNVYRAKPVTVIDNKGTRVTKKIIDTTPTDMAKRAGVNVYPEDKVEIAEPDQALKDGVIGTQVVIDRSTPTNINLYGNNIVARTHAKTVGELLDEKQIKTIPGDNLTPSRDTPITDNIQIFVTSFGKQLTTSEEEIPAPEEKVPDADSLAGTTRVKDPGAAGKKLVTYEIQLQNGKEVSRKAIQEVVSVQPVKKVIAQGTKVIISNPSSNVELGKKIAADMGYNDQFSCIYMIFERESHWNTLAGNASSGAYGIPQALPGSKMGAGWQTDPEVQIRWGINYMVKRYGSPCGAWQHWQVSHNY